MKRISKLAILLLLPFAVEAASVMPYGTYLVKGAFKDDYNFVLRDFGTASVRLKRPGADGAVIAESTITAPNAEGFNFVLRIPVASQSAASACVVGETLDCVFVTPEGSLEVPNALKVDTPIHVGIFSINYTDVKSFTNPKDGSVVEIPVAYVEEAQAFLDELGEGKTYDPWADYDGDGVSNYGEYLAGTHPFDASDRLRITAFSPKDGKLSLKFEHVGGHVYAVSSTDTLAQPAWGRKRVQKTVDGADLDQVLADGADGEPGVTEVFITPLGGMTNEFFRVEPK